MKDNTIKTDERIRNITFMLYEDSCDPNWQEKLDNEHVPYLAILHNKDLNPTGEEKKNHIHVVIAFDGKKSSKQLQYFADLCGAANGKYQEVKNLRTMARYLCHMDNPEKAQYDSSEVRAVALDYNALIGMASDKYKAISEMMDFCDDNNIISYYELMKYARVHKYDWFKCLCDNATLVMKEYLKSKHWTSEQEKLKELENRTY